MVVDKYRFLEGEKYKEQDEPKDIPSTPVVRITDEEYKKPPSIREVKITTRESIPKMLLEKELEPLRKVSPKIIGNLFDRVNFLRERIKHTKASIELRQRLHESIVAEIDKDIEDKRRILERLTDVDDIRDFKLDISMLRMEKRRENVQFWRDMVQLKTELRELLEEYQMETKIASLFKDVSVD